MHTVHDLQINDEATEMVPARSDAAEALAKQEKTIRDATSHAANVIGGALVVIRDKRLYQEAGFERFPLYCEQVLGFKRSRAYQLIEFYLFIRELSTNVEMRGVPLPRTEAQTRPLLKLKDTASRSTIWKDVLNRNGESATKDNVQEAVDYYLAMTIDPSRRDRSRDEIICEYREEKPVGKTARYAPARPIYEALTLPSDDTTPHWDLGTIKRFIRSIDATREALLAEMATEERPKLNDLIGDLRLLADNLELDMDALNEREEGGSGGSI